MKLAALALVVGLTACGPLDTYIEDRLSAAELALYDANLRVVEDTQADIEATEQQILTLSANIRSMAEDMNSEGVRLGLMQLSQKQQDYSKMVANYRKAADDAKDAGHGEEAAPDEVAVGVGPGPHALVCVLTAVVVQPPEVSPEVGGTEIDSDDAEDNQ